MARQEAATKRALIEKDHARRLEAVRDSNRRKTLRDAVAWLKQAARTPLEANMQRSALRPVLCCNDFASDHDHGFCRSKFSSVQALCSIQFILVRKMPEVMLATYCLQPFSLQS